MFLLLNSKDEQVGRKFVKHDRQTDRQSRNWTKSWLSQECGSNRARCALCLSWEDKRLTSPRPVWFTALSIIFTFILSPLVTQRLGGMGPFHSIDGETESQRRDTAKVTWALIKIPPRPGHFLPTEKGTTKAAGTGAESPFCDQDRQ